MLMAKQPAPPITIRLAVRSDWPAIRDLLASEGLPTDDLSPEALGQLQVAQGDTGLLGAVGMDHYGHLALLRSLIVTPAGRRQGIGRQLTQAAEIAAARTGVEEIYLLTESAESFFASLGFRPSNRAQAPEIIQRTRQFSSLCPTTAVLMVKNNAR